MYYSRKENLEVVLIIDAGKGIYEKCDVDCGKKCPVSKYILKSMIIGTGN